MRRPLARLLDVTAAMVVGAGIGYLLFYAMQMAAPPAAIVCT